MKDEAAAVGVAEACIKPSRTKASSYAGLQAAATAAGTVGGAEKVEGAQGLLQSSKDLEKNKQ